MKRLWSLLLILALVISLFTACSDSASSPAPEAPTTEETSAAAETPDASEPAAASTVPLDTLMVGVQEMTGDFINGFGNNAYDLSIKTLTGGYMSTYEFDTQGAIILNTTVIADVDTALDDSGNKTYTFTLHDDIFWNNGDPITARDYLAAVLWFSSPQWAEAGASTVGSNALVGYSDFNEGLTNTFAGAQLISDQQFSLTIAAAELPYYWEPVHVMTPPIHFATYLPSAELISNEEGISLEFTEGDLLTSCENIATTERYAPTITCGPYNFVSFENQTVTLELNEYFKGDIDGNKPTLKYIVQKAVPIETDVEWVINGEVDLVEGVVEGEKIEAAKASASTYQQAYLRAGYGYLAMMCDEGPTADINVRWALASLIDRNAVVEHVLSGYGSTVDAEYGIGQWMYQETAAELQAALKPISFNIDTANQYLDQSAFAFEADGLTAFDSSKALADGSYLRHNAAGEPLIINHLSQENVLTEIIEIQYAANAPLAGMQFNLDVGDWNAVLTNYYTAFALGEARIYNTFSLATNFASVFDRYYTWHSDFLGTNINKPQLSDATLDELIIAMRTTAPDDKEAFLDAWFAYQVRFNELMAQVPLYSNEYYDIAHINVDNLNTTPYASYENLICQITKSAK